MDSPSPFCRALPALKAAFVAGVTYSPARRLTCDLCDAPTANGSSLASVCDACAAVPHEPCLVSRYDADPTQPMEMPVFCSVEVELLRRAADRDAARGTRFSQLPGRLDGGIDEAWGSRRHRMWVRLQRAMRREPKAQPVYLRGPVNGALRGLVVGVVLEAVLVGGSFLFIILQRIY